MMPVPCGSRNHDEVNGYMAQRDNDKIEKPSWAGKSFGTARPKFTINLIYFLWVTEQSQRAGLLQFVCSLALHDVIVYNRS